MSDQLYATLIGLHDDMLLLPNAAVIEVLNKERLLPAEGLHAACIGKVRRGNDSVPVLHFERLNGDTYPPVIAKRTRVVILSNGQQPPFALLSQGHPHLVTINRIALTPMPLRDHDLPDWVLARVAISSQQVLIPDFNRMARLAQSLSA
jgi:chemosensory pili system protein ChpC